MIVNNSTIWVEIQIRLRNQHKFQIHIYLNKFCKTCMTEAKAKPTFPYDSL